MRKLVLITAITAPAKEKVRIDGKASRSFITVTASEALQKPNGSYYPNPFTSASRNIWQKHSADGKNVSWGATSPEALRELLELKAAIPGDIVSHKVKQFPVMGIDGKQNTTKDGKLVFADRYTTVIFGNEDTQRVFKNANHEIVESSFASRAEGTELQKEQPQLQA